MSRILEVALLVTGDDAIIVPDRGQAERLLAFLEDDEPMANVTILGSFSREHLKDGGDR